MQKQRMGLAYLWLLEHSLTPDCGAAANRGAADCQARAVKRALGRSRGEAQSQEDQNQTATPATADLHVLTVCAKNNKKCTMSPIW